MTWNLECVRRVIIVSSTTGDGEQPENVIKFWRKLRPKTLASDHLSHVSYTILGLGDTNYNQFCHAPKSLHRRLSELGAKTFYPPDWADDGTGLEIVVEPWLEGLWSNLCSAEDSVMESVSAEVSQINISSQYKLPACPKSYLSLEFDESQTPGDSGACMKNLVSSAGDCVSARVVSCSLLSQSESEKQVKDYYSLEVDTSNSSYDYNVGDTVGVICRNTQEDLDTLKSHLDLDQEKWFSACRIVLKSESNVKSKIPVHLPTDLTSLEQVFTSLVDIRAVPKKLLIRALLEHTTSSSDREHLSLLCSREGAKQYSVQVTEARLSFLNLLHSVPSCRPPVTLLLEHLPRLLPRPYSLSSSVKETPGRASWIFTKVTDPQPGLATSWMSSLTPGDEIVFYPRTGNSFRPPADPGQDYIMVAAGSGIGPFLGFLKDRKVRLEGGETFTGRCWLIFGCRYRDADFICRDVVEEMTESGVLNKFSSSFSRESEGEAPRYVQNRIETEKEEIFSWITESSAMVYVCGDAKGMAAGVKQVINNILNEKLGDQEGAAFYKDMIAHKKYKEDIWT